MVQQDNFNSNRQFPFNDLKPKGHSNGEIIQEITVKYNQVENIDLNRVEQAFEILFEEVEKRFK